ncbi:MAG: transporter periplasmic component-like protein [Ramlibacter sp.]|jgi:phospholipid/cholesterol/gamma-HCH transport system substrate-binding protein|nr:transporter periplasmic component-like protein [Ramlibacter sp.]MDB5913995.1 transporter periplasmic component-like protein [Ramlibacter sp.]
MENKAHAMAAGLFVTALTVLVLVLAAWLTRDTAVRDTYEISTRETVTGLQEQAPVRFRGVDVGKVSKIGFDPKVVGNVLVKLEVDRDTPLTRDTFAVLSFQGVTGLAFVQLSDEGKPAPRLQPNDEVPPRIPLRPGILSLLEERGLVILDRVQEVSERVNRVLGDENQKRVATALDNLGKAADNATQLTSNLQDTVTKRLDPALAEATVTMRSVQKAVGEVGNTATQFGQTAQRLNASGGPLDRLTEGTDALAGAAESFSSTTLPRLNRVAEETTRTVRSLNRAVNDLTENPQALLYGDGPPKPGPGEPGFGSRSAR